MKDPRFALFGAALLLLAAAPAFTGYAGLGWELWQVAGYAGALACIALCGAPVRPRQAVPPTLLTLKLHTLIGWLAALGVLLHVGGLALDDRWVVEYLKPTAPLYQLAGILAAVLLPILVLSSLTAVRRRLWVSHRGFQVVHVVLACALVVLIAIHVLVTDRYAGGYVRRVLFAATAVGALLMLLRARKSTEESAGDVPLRRQWAFGRYAKCVVGAVAIAAVALVALLPRGTDMPLREPLIRRMQSIPLDFPHGKHTAVNCLLCHHNYSDGRGMEMCIQCHRGPGKDLKVGIEARFHEFCFECHRRPDAVYEHHGPVAGCVVCHHTPETQK